MKYSTSGWPRICNSHSVIAILSYDQSYHKFLKRINDTSDTSGRIHFQNIQYPKINLKYVFKNAKLIWNDKLILNVEVVYPDLSHNHNGSSVIHWYPDNFFVFFLLFIFFGVCFQLDF